MAIRSRINTHGITRRNLFVGLAATGGLAIGWALWPRDYPVNLVAAEGETIFNAWLKIGRDGHVTVAVPQVEMGQGSYTLIAQIIADELGADWRTMGIEPAPLSPAYGNPVFAAEIQDGIFPSAPQQVTGGSSSVRAFEMPARNAAAAARILLCKAAGKKFDADWQACDTQGGFVVRGQDKLRFGELAEEAAGYSLPKEIPLRTGRINRLTGRGMTRLDIPAKLDGSATYAGDIRLRNMVYAAIRQGPIGSVRLVKINKNAAKNISGVIDIIQQEQWVAAIASNWWAANRALDMINPTFVNDEKFVDDASIDTSFSTALKESGKRLATDGDVDAELATGRVYRADYSVGLAPHAALEPITATATLKDGKLQLWIATQAPGAARTAAARAIGLSEEDVTVHATQIGGSFGRKYEIDAAAQVAILAEAMARPVQLIWSRAEDFRQDRFRPAARAQMAAKIEPDGKIIAWRAKYAAPNGLGEMLARTFSGDTATEAREVSTSSSQLAISGAVPPYKFAALGIDHIPVDIGVPTGKWRSGADSYTAFFNECFIDELSHASGVEPFSFRMASLSGNPRLALCLSKAKVPGKASRAIRCSVAMSRCWQRRILAMISGSRSLDWCAWRTLGA
jgi:isoquinoline 1-oxidoreductase subunit beta